MYSFSLHDKDWLQLVDLWEKLAKLAPLKYTNTHLHPFCFTHFILLIL